MNTSIVDTHAHLDMNAFDSDRDEVIARAVDTGVSTIITVGIDVKSSKQAIELAERYPEILATVGIHPHEAGRATRADIDSLAEIATHSRVVAIGEVGLDFYRDYSPRKAQLQALAWQLELAAELEMPVVIHSREAHEEMLGILREWTSRSEKSPEQSPGVIHCFSGDSDTARQYLDMGFYLSLGAYIGYPASREAHGVIRSIPRNRLLVETDCPFLSPQKYRGKRNEPSYLPLTVEVLAKIRKEPLETVAGETTENAHRLFRMSGEV